MTDTPRKETMSSRLAAHLRAAILRGDMAPGSKINLDRLRAAQDVSISPLREAVARLANDGLVEFEDQKGFRVADVSADNLSEVTQMRAALESLALQQAVRRGTLDWESDVMRALYVLTRTAPDAAEDRAAARSEFHRALIRGCGMPMLLQHCALLADLTDRYRRLFGAEGHPPGDVDAAHRALADAAVRRDAATAEALLRAHLADEGAWLQARLSAPG